MCVHQNSFHSKLSLPDDSHIHVQYIYTIMTVITHRTSSNKVKTEKKTVDTNGRKTNMNLNNKVILQDEGGEHGNVKL